MLWDSSVAVFLFVDGDLGLAGSLSQLALADLADHTQIVQSIGVVHVILLSVGMERTRVTIITQRVQRVNMAVTCSQVSSLLTLWGGWCYTGLMDYDGPMCQAKYKNGKPCVHKARQGSPFCGSHQNTIRKQAQLEELTVSVATGRHEALPGRLAQVYNFSLEDSDQLNLSYEMALADARVNDLLRRVDSGESGKLWKDVKDAFKAYKRALKRQNEPEELQAAFDLLNDLITKGYTDTVAWEEMMTHVEQRRKLADTDRRRLTEMNNIVSQEDGLALITRLYEAVMINVTDPDVRAAIAVSMGPLPQDVKAKLAY